VVVYITTYLPLVWLWDNMENKQSYKLRPSIMKILMEDCVKNYTDEKFGYPEKKGCKLTYDDMLEEVVTFYRDAKGLIFRERPNFERKNGKR